MDLVDPYDNGILSFVAKPVLEVTEYLSRRNKQYKIIRTKPVSNMFKIDDNELFVIRQKLIGDIYELVVAAKMGKEVL